MSCPRTRPSPRPRSPGRGSGAGRAAGRPPRAGPRGRPARPRRSPGRTRAPCPHRGARGSGTGSPGPRTGGRTGRRGAARTRSAAEPDCAARCRSRVHREEALVDLAVVVEDGPPHLLLGPGDRLEVGVDPVAAGEQLVAVAGRIEEVGRVPAGDTVTRG